MVASRESIGWRFLFLAGRLALGALIIVTGVALAKIGQSIAVDRLGSSLGFDLASLVGVLPVIVLCYWLAHRFPRLRRRR